MESNPFIAEPTLSINDANRRVLAATSTRVAFEMTENCSIAADTPARNVATVAAFNTSSFVERSSALLSRGIPVLKIVRK